MSLFHLQLLTSFLVGGIAIAGLSLWAERASEKMAGFIISLPSTVAISFAFISWSLRPEAIRNVVPPAPLTMGSVVFFTITYLYVARLRLPKIASMIVSITAALAVWALFAIPIGLLKFSNLWLSVLGYMVFCVIGYYILTARHKSETKAEIVHYTTTQKILRAVICGSVIATAVYLAKTAGPLWGGIFSAFPAVFTSTFLILHWHHNADFLFRIFKNIPIGFLPSLAFMIAAYYAFPALGTVGGLIASYITAIITLLIVKKFSQL